MEYSLCLPHLILSRAIHGVCAWIAAVLPLSFSIFEANINPIATSVATLAVRRINEIIPESTCTELRHGKIGLDTNG